MIVLFFARDDTADVRMMMVAMYERRSSGGGWLDERV